MSNKFVLKLLATIVLFSFVLFKLDVSQVLDVFINSNMFLIFIGLLFIPLLYSIRVLKWNVLLRSVGVKHNFSTVFRALLIGTFYGLITPGKSGEIARAYYLDSKKSITIPTIVWDKLIDIFVLIILSALSALFLLSNSDISKLVIVVSILFMIMSGLLLNKKLIHFMLNFMGINDKSKNQFIETTHLIMNDTKLLLKLIILSICYYIVALILAVISLKALSPNVNSYTAFVYPLIVLIGNLPLTISGLGLREYVTIICFEILGENPEIGFSFSIILFVFTTLIPGFIGYMLICKDVKK